MEFDSIRAPAVASLDPGEVGRPPWILTLETLNTGLIYKYTVTSKLSELDYSFQQMHENNSLYSKNCDPYT